MDDKQLATKYLQKARNAADRGIGFTLGLTSYRNLMKAKRCYFTGLELNDSPEPNPTKRTVDRIDHEKPYESGNVVACCHAFNQLKAHLERSDGIGLEMFQDAVMKTFNDINKLRGVNRKYSKRKASNAKSSGSSPRSGNEHPVQSSRRRRGADATDGVQDRTPRRSTHSSRAVSAD